MLDGNVYIRYTHLHHNINYGNPVAAEKYPLGIQTFTKLREENYLYIDKTPLIYDLIQSGQVYFLSRPRRFGKSLLISTLEALFSGNKSLFEGLAIATTDFDFKASPIVKLEFSKDEFQNADSLREYISAALSDIARRYNIELIKPTYSLQFDELIVKLHQQTGKKVVLLVDEYDKPILNNIDKPALDEIKQVITTFYGVIKPLDEHLRFVFITGVSKFAKMSVFSSMNSLTDISMRQKYANLCGITEAELISNFNSAIDQLATNENLNRDKVLSEIKRWYNGYQFHHNGTGVYNPYSVLSLFEHQEFDNYWFQTGTPTFLIKLLQQKTYDFNQFSRCEVGASAFAASEPENINLPSLFFQTGYLTIKNFDKPLYTMDFPNYEVKKSFFESVTTQYAQIDPGMGETYTTRIAKYLTNGQLDNFFETLAEFFANIPNNITLKNEKYYQSIFYSVITLIGFDISAEVNTNKGRIDCVLQTADTIYIIEFKLNDSAEAALQQIIDKQYAQKYQNKGKSIVLLGVEFDQKTRSLGRFVQQNG